uniref:Uncharacterized protein n=1 Tax=Globodera rostochiensis TaxID=31243 RepID=A0A914HP12_GLORO
MRNEILAYVSKASWHFGLGCSTALSAAASSEETPKASAVTSGAPGGGQPLSPMSGSSGTVHRNGHRHNQKCGNN